jgi:putative PIN family toxin of toxin-antitoxin system
VLRVVLDTNVFVSSLLVKEGPAAQVLDAWRARRYLLIVSPDLAAEIASTLRYPRIRRRYRITEDAVQALLDLLESDAVLVPGKVNVAGSVPEDPDDEIVLACALEGLADLIVSGDRHLLALGVFRGIEIVAVRRFIDRLGEETPS